MGRPLINRIGHKYGMLTVISLAEPYINSHGKKIYRWLCKCECGRYTTIDSSDLNDKIISCGCWRRKRASMLGAIYGKRAKYEKGETETKLYERWCEIKQRCYYIHKDKYRYYGGRGIEVCEEWKNNYLSFKDWSLNNGYRDELSLERINVNGNYEPSNCCWIELKNQARNKMNTVWIHHEGVTKSLVEWCEIYNKNYKTSHRRYKKGMNFEEIFELNKE